MIQEALEYLVRLGRPNQIELQDRVFVDKDMHLLEPPRQRTICVNTLQGIVDYYAKNVDKLEEEDLFFIVLDENKVTLAEMADNIHRTRNILVEADTQLYKNNFPFDRKLRVDDFVLQLQANFEPTYNLSLVLKLVGNMRAEKIKVSKDDGITQSVVAKSGVVGLEEVSVPNPVALKPYRTFREVPQPESNFVFRIHQSRDDELPTCSLTEADGSSWKLEAIANIKSFITLQLGTEVSILA